MPAPGFTLIFAKMDRVEDDTVFLSHAQAADTAIIVRLHPSLDSRALHRGGLHRKDSAAGAEGQATAVVLPSDGR